ncbi:quinol dehydrogenase ferredoxin subunit NapH [Hafnia paralvei]|jgi:ferredoxin-type protein NapH|uniref:quinol dehydrogenase ferredoxin subunit NapH n=2 Tax=Hafnia paralvei TaxID=546367 RepID=UPI0014196F3A|nr:quinol dehydrogenase ferredoxin subunit NapH [Hafnia paralvei]MBW2957222.1 quinol dehydrogenase ferredoxin subunit NapH [Hafnia paralvei]MCE9909626.1 quinol dehydrogenase ferredoxin subunit NapH [Hafnia paralvei]MCE9912876.1 quinol dehydrogenase ferredoxin subunit NapH [Hafnia paralvei]MCQ4171776.1 quinol dehydrogenase ferredoxin subunit NapH [Hafnia paralvei]MDX6910628.1 quinol dehydrogenase ferredoxin subunit NapH [Hafnia paralvei]
MANSASQAGRDARQRHGFIRSHRWLLLRRLSQLAILMMFLSGPWFGVWILKGNYSGSLLLDTVPLTDPLMMLESLFAGHWPALTALAGALVIVAIYALIASRAFCAWVCPLNPVTDLAAWMRRKLNIRQSASLPRGLRYGILLAVLAGSAVSGTLLWEWLNPVALLGRSLIFGAVGGLWLIVAVFLFDLLVTEHGWCGHICPMGALYGVIGAKAMVRVSAEHREKCTRCMDCFHVCPESQVLREPVLNNDHSPLVLSKDCISCGRCMDVCAEHVFEFKNRFHRSGAKE